MAMARTLLDRMDQKLDDIISRLDRVEDHLRRLDPPPGTSFSGRIVRGSSNGRETLEHVGG